MTETNVANFDADLLEEMRANGFFSPEEIAALSSADTASHKTSEAVTKPENEVVEIALPDDDVEALESAVAQQELKEQVYAAQESGADLITENVTQTDKKASKPHNKKTGDNLPKRTPRVADGSMGAFVAKLLGEQMELTPGNAVEIAPLVDQMPVKIKEKAAGVFEAITKGKSPSIFVKIGLEVLKNEGAISGKRLVEVFTSGTNGKAYSIGTARSQSQQIVSLFRTLCITDANGRTNPDSTILPKLIV